MALRPMGLAQAGSNFVNSYMMGKQVQAERAEQEKQNQIKSLMGGMLMGQSTPEQQQQFSQLAPTQFVNTQNYLQGQAATKAAAVDALDDKRSRSDLMQLASTNDEALQNQILDQRIADITAGGGNPSDTQQLRDMPFAQRQNWIQMKASDLKIKMPGDADKVVKGTSQLEFESLTEGLSDEQAEEAVLIKLGISPRAVSSADITIAESEELTDQVANSKSIIAERKKFAELTGSSRAQAIDKGFERILKIDTAVGNIDNAIRVLESGAGVGAIEKYLPSFKAASVELDNIQNSMALDVVGAVTFGALSKGELDLAKEVALPTGLNTQELIEYLQNRRVAQGKLREYFNEQIQFLDQGGTIAGFLREKERDSNKAAPVNTSAPGRPADQDPGFVPAAPVTTPQALNWSDLP